MEIITALIIGLAGSLHCAGMCGPLALALPQTGPGAGRLVAGRLFYNAGRVVTYCAIGVIVGAVGQTLFMAGLQRWMSICLGILLLASLFMSWSKRLSGTTAILLGKLKSRMAVVLRQRSLASLLLLGLLNGFLPCGLVYVAAAAAAGTGRISGAVEYMAAFGLGTVPMMLGIGLTGHLLPPTLRLKFQKAIPVSVFIVAALLILRGMALGIPYLSPDLAGAGCCHK